MPIVSPVPQSQDQTLYWEQEAAKRDAARQNAAKSAVNQPASATMIDPAQNYQQAQQSILQRGESATQGVIQSVATERQRQKEEQQAAFQQQMSDSIDAVQKQAQQYQDNLSAKYAAQAAQYQAKWDQFTAAFGSYTDALGHYNSAQAAEYNKQKSAYDKAHPAVSGVPSVGNLSGQAYTGKPAQIAQYARQAGFPASAIPTAVAIAMAESSGRADAMNTANSNGSTDYGLMQINSIHSSLLQGHDWADPAQNMQMAYQVWKDAGGSFSPWVTYNNGAYQQFMKIGDQASSSVQKAAMQPYQVQTDMGLRTAITRDAKQYLGLPYVWGGTDLSRGVDCSGLVQSVYKQMGINLPRTANEQAHYGAATSINNLVKGDLVAWTGGWHGPNPTEAQKQPSYVGHIAIYLGNGKIIESPYTGATVRIRDLRPDEKVYGVHLSVLDK